MSATQVPVREVEGVVSTEVEVLRTASECLLEAIDKRDWDTYEELCGRIMFRCCWSGYVVVYRRGQIRTPLFAFRAMKCFAL